MAGCRGGDPRPERATKKKQGCCALVLTLLFVELCATGERSGIRGSQGGAETAERGGAVARSFWVTLVTKTMPATTEAGKTHHRVEPMK